MSKFCTNCGQEAPDDAAACNSCGNQLDMGVVQSYVPPVEPVSNVAATEDNPVQQNYQPDPAGYQPAQQNYQPDSTGYQPASAPKKPLNKKLIGLLSGFVALTAAIVFVVMLIVGSGPKGTVKKYLNATLKGDFKKMQKYSAVNYETLLKEHAKAKGLSETEVLIRTNGLGIKGYLTETLNQIKLDAAGSKVSFKVVDSRKLTPSEVGEVKVDIAKSLMGMGIEPQKVIRLDDIKEIRECYVETTVDREPGDTTFLVLKIKGKWRVLDPSFGSFSPFDRSYSPYGSDYPYGY